MQINSTFILKHQIHCKYQSMSLHRKMDIQEEDLLAYIGGSDMAQDIDSLLQTTYKKELIWLKFIATNVCYVEWDMMYIYKTARRTILGLDYDEKNKNVIISFVAHPYIDC